MEILTLIPAYGRDYSSAKAVQADWDAGKDFRISASATRWDGSYVSKRDVPRASVSVRYKSLTRVTQVQRAS